MGWSGYCCLIIHKFYSILKKKTTDFSPYEIMFGRPIAFPSSVVVDPPLEPSNPQDDKIVSAYISSLKD